MHYTRDLPVLQPYDDVCGGGPAGCAAGYVPVFTAIGFAHGLALLILCATLRRAAGQPRTQPARP